MTQPTQADRNAAEEIVSAANIVSHDGYYEIDIDAVFLVVAAHRERERDAIVEVCAQVAENLSPWDDTLSKALADHKGAQDMIETSQSSLRDYIATHALAGLLATNQDFHDENGDGWDWHARAAYSMADAMLAARIAKPVP